MNQNNINTGEMWPRNYILYLLYNNNNNNNNSNQIIVFLYSDAQPGIYRIR